MADEKEDVAKSEEGGEAAGAAGEAKSGPAKSSMIIIIVVALLVVVVTPLATYLVIKNVSADPVVSIDETAKVKAGAEELVTLKAITINIAETKGTRILRMEPHLVVSEARLVEQLKAVHPLLTDRIILAASRKTIDDLEGAQGREALKREIISEINASIKGRMAGAVVDVYFSEFLIQ